MADTKITALTALTAADPANDVLPIVDVSDTTMAASGTTKKISVNNILGASGTATLASATITGALTVQGVGGISIGSASFTSGRALAATSPAGSAVGIRLLQSATSDWEITNVATAGNLSITQSGANLLSLTGAGVFTFGDGAGGTRMTLNSTGLGVGGSPVNPLTVFAAASAKAPALLLTTAGSPTYGWDFSVDGAVNGNLFIRRLVAGTKTDVLEFDRATGTVGIGVTPSAWSAGKAVELAFKGNSLWSYAQDNNYLSSNAYFNGGWKYGGTGKASLYSQYQGTHIWSIAGSGTAGNAITLTDAMTLDASGRLLVGTTAVPNVGAATTSSGFSINGSGDAAYIASKIDNGTCGYFRRDGTDGAILNFYKANSAVGNISVTASACTFNSTSDYRLKESVQPLTGGLARVSALKPSIYKWKADGSSGEGFLAHELAEVVPAAVSGEKDAVNEDGSIKPQGVDMSRVVPILVAAIQELTAEVNALKNA